MPVHKSAEEAAPPLPSCSITHYENGSAPEIIVSPSPLEKPKRNGTRLNEGRPTVETLLDELEGSVPSPSPRPSDLHSELDTPSQQQARISASCATRELDELMASLSDFKVPGECQKLKATYLLSITSSLVFHPFFCAVICLKNAFWFLLTLCSFCFLA